MFALPRNQLGDLALYSAEAWEGIIHLLGYRCNIKGLKEWFDESAWKPQEHFKFIQFTQVKDAVHKFVPIHLKAFQELYCNVSDDILEEFTAQWSWTDITSYLTLLVVWEKSYIYKSPTQNNRALLEAILDAVMPLQDPIEDLFEDSPPSSKERMLLEVLTKLQAGHIQTCDITPLKVPSEGSRREKRLHSEIIKIQSHEKSPYNHMLASMILGMHYPVPPTLESKDEIEEGQFEDLNISVSNKILPGQFVHLAMVWAEIREVLRNQADYTPPVDTNTGRARSSFNSRSSLRRMSLEKAKGLFKSRMSAKVVPIISETKTETDDEVSETPSDEYSDINEV